ncbi:ribonuclease H [Chitinimonas sp. BJB300]|uniref:ribonuclease H n=1 Tax=Chitinimonas sp. BJB300 TaxID=1559339 RepID=UPI000C0DAFD6|nr:ribonuclease H [Chitinimonas sp. BJB300]PHV12075.1 ribonuclease H [Chitinimonas sp. BJB300]TSJ87321.1 ribonuclease H [Chitinimonas sp. BJB300]
MHKPELFFDIETLPTRDPEVIAQIEASITAPGNYTKAESIAQWEIEKKPALVEEAIRKTSFDPWFGQILCIGVAFDDEAPFTLSDHGEYGVLCKFLALLDRRYKSLLGNTNPPKVIGHNVTGFDLRYVWVRCIINGLRPPEWWPVDAKPWDNQRVFDTMTHAAGVGGRVSLDKLCKALGIPTPKGELDGSKVYDYYKAGRINEILTYCAGDVEAMRKVYHRLAFIEMDEPELLAA